MVAIHGRVVDASGEPVAGAVVYVISAPVNVPDIAAITDANGSFSIGAPVAGHYRFGVNPGAGEPVSTEIMVAGTEDVFSEVRVNINRA